MGLAFGLLLLLGQDPAAAEPPEIRAVEVTGASVYTAQDVERLLRLRPGQRLYRSAAAVAAALETRYHDDGYVAARVDAGFDAATGILSLHVDEGRLVELVLDGLTGAGAARAVNEMALPIGAVVRDRELRDALRRLEEASEETVLAAGEPPYSIAAHQGGVRVTAAVRPVRARFALGGPGDAALYQRVDGFAPGAGGRLRLGDFGGYNHSDLYGRYAYGFESERSSYAFGAQRSFGWRRLLTASYEFHDATTTDDSYRVSALEETLAAALFARSYRDYHRTRGHQLSLFAQLSPRLQLGLVGRSDSYASVPALTSRGLFDTREQENPVVAEGLSRSLIAVGRWSSRGSLDEGLAAERRSYLAESLYGRPGSGAGGVRVETTLEIASATNAIPAYTRFIGSVREHRTTRLGTLDARFLLGLGSGQVPPQKLFALGGPGTLRGYDFKQFRGEDMVLVNAEISWPGVFPRPGVAVFFDGGGVSRTGGPGTGFKSDLGIGVVFGFPGGVGIRLDGALALEKTRPARVNNADRFRLSVRLRAPF